MIRNNLAILLAERNMKISDLAKMTGISRSTLTTLSNNDSSGVQFETLNKIALSLEIVPSDFFDYFPADISIEKDYFDAEEDGDFIFGYFLNVEENNEEYSCYFDGSAVLKGGGASKTIKGVEYENYQYTAFVEFNPSSIISIDANQKIGRFNIFFNKLPTTFKYSLLDLIYNEVAKGVAEALAEDDYHVDTIELNVKSMYKTRSVSFSLI